jgi:hypothetical protein
LIVVPVVAVAVLIIAGAAIGLIFLRPGRSTEPTVASAPTQSETPRTSSSPSVPGIQPGGPMFQPNVPILQPSAPTPQPNVPSVSPNAPVAGPGRDVPPDTTPPMPPSRPSVPDTPLDKGPPVPGLEIGNLALEISGQDIDGKRFKLSDYRGKVVVLDFWGNW